MTLSPTRFRQVMFFAAAVVLLACGFGMQGRLDERTKAHQPLSNVVVHENHPDLVLFETMPGGLRAIAVNFLWMRSENLKQDGKYHQSCKYA